MMRLRTGGILIYLSMGGGKNLVYRTFLEMLSLCINTSETEGFTMRTATGSVSLYTND